MKKTFPIISVLILMILQLAFATEVTIEKCCMDKVEQLTNISHACCDNESNEDNCALDDSHHCNCIYNLNFISPQTEISFKALFFYIKPMSHISEGKVKTFLEDIFQPPWV